MSFLCLSALFPLFINKKERCQISTLLTGKWLPSSLVFAYWAHMWLPSQSVETEMFSVYVKDILAVPEYTALQRSPGYVINMLIGLSKVAPANAGGAGDAGLIPGLGRSPEEGNGNPLQYSCLENTTIRGSSGLCSPWDRGARHVWARMHCKLLMKSSCWWHYQNKKYIKTN